MSASVVTFELECEAAARGREVSHRMLAALVYNERAYPRSPRSRTSRSKGSEGERILPATIVERFARDAGGELERITAESTRPIAETRTHAGIVKVTRYAFEMP